MKYFTTCILVTLSATSVLFMSTCTHQSECAGKDDFTPCSMYDDIGYIGDPVYEIFSYKICIDELCVMPGCGSSKCNAPGPNFPMTPVTGSHYVRNLSISDQPVVHDTITGLDWQGCTAGLSGDECSTGGALTGDDVSALEYCDSLDWGGYSDWRLPNTNELLSIVDYGVMEPAIDITAFPNTKATIYHSSDYHWVVDFHYGLTVSPFKTDVPAFRCIRGSAMTVKLPRFTRTFTKTDEPVVYDTVTGLTWQGCTAGMSGPDCKTGSYVKSSCADAQAYCESLNWGGMSDWRLPNIKELESIADMRGNLCPAFNGPFINMSGGYFCSSTPTLYLEYDNFWVYFCGMAYIDDDHLGKKYLLCITGL